MRYAKNKMKVKSKPNSKIDIMLLEIKKSLAQGKSGNTIKTAKK